MIPQTGYKITEVTANGVELEETDPENIASPSNAERADEAVYYTIPEVLEDQEVEIFLEEIVPGTHPAFEYAENINGVIVTISAAEGILPEGTTREFDTSKLKRILQSLETGLFFCQIFVFII